MAAVFGAAGVSMAWTARHRRKLIAGGEMQALASRIDLGMIASMLIILGAFWAMIVARPSSGRGLGGSAG